MATSTTTRVTLLGRIRERLLLTFWSDTEINLFINEALRVWNMLTSISTYGAGTSGVIIPINTIFFETTTDNEQIICYNRLATTAKSLDFIRLRELDFLNPGWQSAASGTVSTFTTVGLNTLIFSPAPSAGVTLYRDVVYQFVVPTADGDTIVINSEDLNAIIDYVIFAVKLKEGGSETQEAQTNLQSFLKQAAIKNAALNNFSSYRRILGMPMGGQHQKRPDTMQSLTSR